MKRKEFLKPILINKSKKVESIRPATKDQQIQTLHFENELEIDVGS